MTLFVGRHQNKIDLDHRLIHNSVDLAVHADLIETGLLPARNVVSMLYWV
jgi:hypothetical protein